MRISDWSSDVCSSDLIAGTARLASATLSMIDWFIIASSWVSISQRRAPGIVDRQPAAVQEPRRRKSCPRRRLSGAVRVHGRRPALDLDHQRSEEHTSELQSLMRISYAVFCLKKNKERQ